MRLVPSVLLAGSCFVSGCAGFEAQRAPLDEPDSPITVLQHLPAQGPLAAASLFKPASATATFDVVDGDKKGTSVVIKRSPTTRFGAAWAEAEDDVRTEFYKVTDEGHVLLTAAVDHDENAISLFDPPLTAIYAALPPDEPLVQESRIRIMDARNPARQREAGKATQTIEHLGRATIRTASGQFTVDRLSVKFDANLRLARARRESMLYVLEGVGIVAAEHEETVTALGLFSRTSRQTLVRRASAVAASDKH